MIDKMLLMIIRTRYNYCIYCTVTKLQKLASESELTFRQRSRILGRGLILGKEQP